MCIIIRIFLNLYSLYKSLIIDLEIGLSNLTNNNTRCSVKSEFRTYDEQFFSISMSQILMGYSCGNILCLSEIQIYLGIPCCMWPPSLEVYIPHCENHCFRALDIRFNSELMKKGLILHFFIEKSLSEILLFMCRTYCVLPQEHKLDQGGILSVLLITISLPLRLGSGTKEIQ